jgi:hypothetical protein
MASTQTSTQTYRDFSTKLDETGNISQNTNNNTKTIFDFQRDVQDKLNVYYTAYSQYLRCRSNVSNKQNCPSTAINSPSAVNTAKTELDTAIAKYKTAYSNLPLTGISSQTYQQKYNDIISNYENLTKLRTELDSKLEQIHNKPESVLAAYQTYSDTTIGASLIWTVLATSILYYAFTNM